MKVNSLSSSSRILPSSVEAWRPILQRAVTLCNQSQNILSPPHFQTYCINPQTNKVLEGFNYAKFNTNNRLTSPKRKSGVLVLVEPVKYVSKNQNSTTNNNKALPLLQNELRTFVTRRTSHLRTHKGEISYPGGKCDGNETVEEAAIREGMEEIGADPSKYEIIGELSKLFAIPSRSVVTPVLALSKGVSVVEVDEADLIRRHERLAQKLKIEDERKKLKGKKLPPFEPSKNDSAKNNNLPLSSLSLPPPPPSSLDLTIASPDEVESIQTINLLELMLSTDKHFFIEREYQSLQMMLPAFYTFEEQDLLWGYTGFMLTELLSVIAKSLLLSLANSSDNSNAHDDVVVSSDKGKEKEKDETDEKKTMMMKFREEEEEEEEKLLLLETFTQRSPPEFFTRFEDGIFCPKYHQERHGIRKMVQVGRHYLPVWYPKTLGWMMKY